MSFSWSPHGVVRVCKIKTQGHKCHVWSNFTRVHTQSLVACLRQTLSRCFSKGKALKHSLWDSMLSCIALGLLKDYKLSIAVLIFVICLVDMKGGIALWCLLGVPPVPSMSGEVWLHWTARNPGNGCKAPVKAPRGGSSSALPIWGP